MFTLSPSSASIPRIILDFHLSIRDICHGVLRNSDLVTVKLVGSGCLSAPTVCSAGADLQCRGANLGHDGTSNDADG